MNANLSRKFRKGNALIGLVVITVFAVSGYAQATGKDAPKPASVVSRGGGVGGANGVGVGAASGTAMGGASGSGLGSPTANGTIIMPSEMQLFKKLSNRKVNATDIRLGSGVGTSVGRGIAPTDEKTAGSGTGTSSGNGTAGEATQVFRAEPVTKTYIQELDGSCYYVTNLGAKRYVAKAKCSIE